MESQRGKISPYKRGIVDASAELEKDARDGCITKVLNVYKEYFIMQSGTHTRTRARTLAESSMFAPASDIYFFPARNIFSEPASRPSTHIFCDGLGLEFFWFAARSATAFNGWRLCHARCC
jgi:hypothetical protein